MAKSSSRTQMMGAPANRLAASDKHELITSSNGPGTVSRTGQGGET